MAQATAPLGPQNAGAQGGIIPFWAASQPVIFDNFTADSWTPGASVANLFQSSLAELKSYGYANKLWLKFYTATAGSTGGTFNADGPMNAFSVLRIQDPNGHAIFDADSFGLYLYNKYGAREWVGDPVKLPNASFALGGTTGTGSPQFDLLLPFCVNEEIGLGALANMDASGPYRIIAQGAIATGAGGIYQTAPTTTTPTIGVQVGGDFFSLPSATSRVNGQPQAYLPPLLDRGLAVVNEFTKTTISVSATGQQSKKLSRVGNIISQIYFVFRDSSGNRIAATTSTTLAAGTRLQLSFDSVPLWDADPQHVIDGMMRKRAGGLSYDTGVILFDRRSPANMAMTQLGLDGGLDSMLQTAQTTDLELAFNAGSTLNGGSIDVYTSDITVTNMVTGEKYSFAYGGQLLLPAPPGQIRS